jgi:hypothetical protein
MLSQSAARDDDDSDGVDADADDQRIMRLKFLRSGRSPGFVFTQSLRRLEARCQNDEGKTRASKLPGLSCFPTTPLA